MRRSKGISLFLIAITVLVSVGAYAFLPDSIAIQFSGNNEPSNAAPKYIGLLIAPAVMIFFHVTKEMRSRGVHRANLLDTTVFFLLSQGVLACIQLFTIGYNLGLNLNISAYINILLGIVLIVIGNVLHRAVKGFGQGISNRWTLSNLTVWKKTHRVSSFIFIGAGVLPIALNVVRQPYLTSISAFILGASILLCYVSSYLFYLKYRNV
ncbi:hypothetical protein A374_07181 [Fictibacillus macauensis ZFHKF-1]|uniref:DUF1648 domain-containing protein n=2 Tax=Fictibacillus TaxID=1329200 RepID=I8AKJ2_9BACL|nr:hypothetical protein A374_07181 [Fictibacillus macauensis ZFHKF-1]